MALTSRSENFDSAVDEIISIVRRCHLEKQVDEFFLHDLKLLIKNKMRPRLMKQAAVKSVLNTELKCLPLPNEILVKIFGYLNIQEISRSAQVSHQFNMISKDSSLWQTWGKLSIDGKKVPTEFLTYIIQRGITELSLYGCEILPPRAKLTVLIRPLNLKTLCLEDTKGDQKLVNEILTSQPMEKVELIDWRMSENDISQFINVLPQIGSQLKNLNLENGILGKFCDLSSIYSIVNNCLSLEELNLSGNLLNKETIYYLCSHLTSNILKLDLRVGGQLEEHLDNGLNDSNVKELVERCPKLKVLDIRSNEKITYQGLVAISDGLHFLEILALPFSVGDELGLPDNINLSKMSKLRSVKKLEELFIGDHYNEYQDILKSEIPHLNADYDDTFVANANYKYTDYKEVKFCPNCHESEDWYDHRCFVK